MPTGKTNDCQVNTAPVAGASPRVPSVEKAAKPKPSGLIALTAGARAASER